MIENPVRAGYAKRPLFERFEEKEIPPELWNLFSKVFEFATSRGWVKDVEDIKKFARFSRAGKAISLEYTDEYELGRMSVSIIARQNDDQDLESIIRISNGRVLQSGGVETISVFITCLPSEAGLSFPKVSMTMVGANNGSISLLIEDDGCKTVVVAHSIEFSDSHLVFFDGKWETETGPREVARHGLVGTVVNDYTMESLLTVADYATSHRLEGSTPGYMREISKLLTSHE